MYVHILKHIPPQSTKNLHPTLRRGHCDQQSTHASFHDWLCHVVSFKICRKPPWKNSCLAYWFCLKKASSWYVMLFHSLFPSKKMEKRNIPSGSLW